MTVRVYQSGTARPTLDTYAAPMVGGRRLRNRSYSNFWLASVLVAFLIGLCIGLVC